MEAQVTTVPDRKICHLKICQTPTGEVGHGSLAEDLPKFPGGAYGKPVDAPGKPMETYMGNQSNPPKPTGTHKNPQEPTRTCRNPPGTLSEPSGTHRTRWALRKICQSPARSLRAAPRKICQNPGREVGGKSFGQGDRSFLTT